MPGTNLSIDIGCISQSGCALSPVDHPMPNVSQADVRGEHGNRLVGVRGRAGRSGSATNTGMQPKLNTAVGRAGLFNLHPMVAINLHCIPTLLLLSGCRQN